MTHIPHQITHYMQKENLFTKSGIPSKKAKVNYFTGKISAKDMQIEKNDKDDNDGAVV